MECDHDPRKLTAQQQAAWDKRCLIGMLGNVLRMKKRFAPDELTQVINAINQATCRVDAILHTPKPMVAKKWSAQR